MLVIKDHAIVCHKYPYGESDLLISLFTRRHGRLTAIAKGARRSRKRFPGRLELFSLVRATLASRRPTSLPRLDECEIIHPFQQIQHRPRAFFAGCYFLEIINRCCPEMQANEPLFQLTGELLAFLHRDGEENRRNFACQVRLFELQAVALLGYAPRLDRCLDCGDHSPAAPFFAPGLGGLVCAACRPRHPEAFAVSRGTVALLDKSRKINDSLRQKLNFTPRVMTETARLCRSLLQWHTGREFRTAKYLDAWETAGETGGQAQNSCQGRQTALDSKSTECYSAKETSQ
ncbi:MAG: DNA repair protein RecO [Deltaproteobacteria bacterium]|nr:DNA repair protein RecO [Deltaproteobacteria bacterium]